MSGARQSPSTVAGDSMSPLATPTTTLRPYPTYKPSGIDWLDKIPTHWSVERGKTLFKRLDRPVPLNAETVTCFRDGVVTLRSNRRITGFTEALQEIGYQGVHQGDLVIHAMDAFAGAVGVSDSTGKCTPVYSVCAPINNANPNYYARVIREMALNGYIQAQAKGIRERSTDYRFESFARTELPVPPPSEQQAITDFLDAIDERITRFIEARRRMIALLEEQKQVIITQAVTRGLDPDVPMKPSGIDWLGDIPAHWEVRALKHELLNMNTRRIPLSSEERGSMKEQNYDYYGASGVIDQVSDYIFDDDLLLIAEDGANLTLRNLPLAIIARGKFWVNNHAHILKPIRGCLEYFTHLLEAIDYSPWVSGAAQPKLTQERLMAIRIPIPPFAEQKNIVNDLAKLTAEIDSVISRNRQEMDLVQEYRSRLISDVVTGKLDVREVNTNAERTILA